MIQPSRSSDVLIRVPMIPMDRLNRIAAEEASRYPAAVPYPHVVLDSFFDDGLLDQIVAEFPKDTDIKWQRFDDERQKKLASSNEADMSPLIRHFLYELNSGTFLRFLDKLTGIRGLISDPYFQGGGFHQIMPGGTLGVHTDFNKHPTFDLDRRVNVIIWLNREWKEEYGGHFEMWDSDVAHCFKRVLPIFNRMVVFNTNDFSFHGHPEPLRCPAGMSRKSLALYYFSNGRPDSEVKHVSGTSFLPRPGERETFKEFVKSFVPPSIWNLRAKIKKAKTYRAGFKR